MMQQNKLIALGLIASGGIIGAIMSFVLPIEKLQLALSIPGSLVGYGLAKLEN